MTPILDTPDDLLVFRMLQWKYMLRLQIRTGLRHSRGSVKNAVCDYFGWPRSMGLQATSEQLEAIIDGCTEYLTEDPA
jgi:hypothetical protein